MVAHGDIRGWYRSAVILLALSALVPGCTGGSLATDSGPGGGWSTLKQQYVHVGEKVNFSFAMSKGLFRKEPRDPFGVVDYCIATAGDERIEAELDRSGRFRFTYNVVRLRPGDVVNVSAAAYQEKGIRDVMQIGDEWVRADTPYDQSDFVMATDSIELLVYRTLVELSVPDAQRRLDLASGRLELRKHDGTTTTIYAAEEGSRGFTISEPDADGRYLVRYHPTADEINKFDTTYVRFTAFDHSGGAHDFDGHCPTP
ncbi:MAG: hypothetical protein V3W34_07175 [Phycisphaerae bacterium]